MMPFITAAVLAAFVGYAGAWYFELIQQRTPVGALRQRLLFGKAQCEALAA